MCCGGLPTRARNGERSNEHICELILLPMRAAQRWQNGVTGIKPGMFPLRVNVAPVFNYRLGNWLVFKI
jgi:hypothetical protein